MVVAAGAGAGAEVEAAGWALGLETMTTQNCSRRSLAVSPGHLGRNSVKCARTSFSLKLASATVLSSGRILPASKLNEGRELSREPLVSVRAALPEKMIF